MKRTLIERKYQRFHDDEVFVSWLQAHHPHLYRRVIWEMEALKRAEAIAVGFEQPAESHNGRHVQHPTEADPFKQKVNRELARTKVERGTEAEFNKLMDELGITDIEDRESEWQQFLKRIRTKEG